MLNTRLEAAQARSTRALVSGFRMGCQRLGAVGSVDQATLGGDGCSGEHVWLVPERCARAVCCLE